MAIAKMRDRMSKASIVELMDIKKEIEKKCKGGNEHIIFDESLMRDLYAYAVINFLNIYDFTVFGGFVAAHLSGKPWNDIDIMMPRDEHSCYDHVLKIIAFLKLSFGFKPIQLQLHEGEVRRYARVYELRITENDIVHAIKIDVVRSVCCNQKMLWLPVTIGKCLLLKDNVISLRSIPKATPMLLPWKVDDVIDLLRNGNDVGLSFPHPSQSRCIAYRSYWWLRIDRLRRLGYVVDKFLGCTPLEPTKRDQSGATSSES